MTVGKKGDAAVYPELEDLLRIFSKDILLDAARNRGIKKASKKLDKDSLVELILQDVAEFPERELCISNGAKPKEISFEEGKSYLLKSPGMEVFTPVMDKDSGAYELVWNGGINIPIIIDLLHMCFVKRIWPIGIDLGERSLRIPRDAWVVTDYSWIRCGYLTMGMNSRLIGIDRCGLRLSVSNTIYSEAWDKESRPEVTTTPYEFGDRIPFNPEYRIYQLEEPPERARGREGDRGAWGSRRGLPRPRNGARGYFEYFTCHAAGDGEDPPGSPSRRCTAERAKKVATVQVRRI